MTHIPFSSLKSAALLVCTTVVLLTSCQNKADDPGPTAQANAETQLMKEFLGDYTVDGVYAQKILNSHTLQLRQTSPTEWEFSGPGYPSFKITKPYKAFQSGKNPGEYTIISQAVGPDDGSISFENPGKKIVIAIDLTTASGKKFLTLTGKKN